MDKMFGIYVDFYAEKDVLVNFWLLNHGRSKGLSLILFQKFWSFVRTSLILYNSRRPYISQH